MLNFTLIGKNPFAMSFLIRSNEKRLGFIDVFANKERNGKLFYSARFCKTVPYDCFDNDDWIICKCAGYRRMKVFWECYQKVKQHFKTKGMEQ